ncbi:DsbA family protein [Erythrobacter litoralis]|uniref:Protein-disulfide isomerase n=1 Tax=Erythrobacter litoralis (strain HTCC2594) TaxID=314225 RepID=Q2N931_ERYLH|nr:thioredoxin domain-containing protein [Erythrobacter litoralis]ABC63810.1 protein-disulfide isomerase [Erythrobacter litoralis HTCC2594]
MIASRRLTAGMLAVAALATMGMMKNWVTEVERTEVSHIVGNPEAEGTLTEFVSYTCPACGNFARQGEEVVKLGYVGPGKARLEIRHVQRNVVDIAATLLAWCGPKEKFLQNHSALMWQQDKWLTKAQQATQGQQQRWFSGAEAARYKAIANDLSLYELFEGRGYDRPQLDRCLSDTALAAKFRESTVADAETFGVRATPSFAIDGEFQSDVTGWSTLAPKLSEKF